MSEKVEATYMREIKAMRGKTLILSGVRYVPENEIQKNPETYD